MKKYLGLILEQYPCYSHKIFELKYILYISESESVSGSVVSDSLPPYGLGSGRLLCPWNSLGRNSGVG